MDWDNICSHFITSLNSASYAFRSGVGKPCDFMKSGSGAKLKVAVISDTHLRNDFKSTAAFQTGIKRMSCAEPAYDALVIDGDCTNRSYESQNKEIMRLLKKYNCAKTVIPVMGNHDTGLGTKGTDGYEACMTRHMKVINMYHESKTPYFYKVINGYYFITLSSESDRLEDNEDMSDEQIAWLDARLYDAEKTGLLVFIFNHYAFNNTMQIEKIWPEGELGERSDELRALLQKHKNLKIFFITGHIHNYFGVNKIETDGNIIMLDVPSYGKENFSFENGYDKPTEHPELGIGYQMEVYDNRVEFKAVDFNRGKWHKEFDLEIDI